MPGVVPPLSATPAFRKRALSRFGLGRFNSWLRLRSWQKEVSESEDEVDSKQLQAFKPIGAAVTRNLSRDQR
jgi:hypothetical protein